MLRKSSLIIAALSLAVTAGAANAEPKQGGEMVVTYKDDISTLDPAIGYDWQNWSMIKSLFDGLMDYKPGTTELIPDLAESYTISADGLTYEFKLRPGVTFHNGRALTSEDIKYSIDICKSRSRPACGYSSIGTSSRIRLNEVRSSAARPTPCRASCAGMYSSRLVENAASSIVPSMILLAS